jgi:Uma2 family endonuclease
MRDSRSKRSFISVSQYLESEERRPTRHEYFRGEEYVMHGGTRRHSQIAVNIITRFATAARGTGCTVFNGDFKVQPTDEAVYYPDISVVCITEDGSAVVTRSPCLVVEVSSRSTVRIDRGEKVEQYCKSPSLRGYLIVDQNRKRVTSYLRGADDAWERTDVQGDGAIDLPCPRARLTLDEIYEAVSLPPLGVGEPELDEETGDYVGASR